MAFLLFSIYFPSLSFSSATFSIVPPNIPSFHIPFFIHLIKLPFSLCSSPPPYSSIFLAWPILLSPIYHLLPLFLSIFFVSPQNFLTPCIFSDDMLNNYTYEFILNKGLYTLDIPPNSTIAFNYIINPG